MASPIVHAESSARKFGGQASDYLDIHELLDSSKQAMADNRHRAITHHSWFIINIIPRIFGAVRTNSTGKTYAPKDVAEQHVLEDFKMKFIPTAQDYLEEIEFKPWMQNGLDYPSSAKKLQYARKVNTIRATQQQEEYEHLTKD